MFEIFLGRLGTDLPLPAKGRAGDAAIDLPASDGDVIPARQRRLVSTGFGIALPENSCGLVLSRSGLALEHGVVVLNAPGLIDSGYRGEIKVILANTADTDFVFESGHINLANSKEKSLLQRGRRP